MRTRRRNPRWTATLVLAMLSICSCAPAEDAAPPSSAAELTEPQVAQHTHHTIDYIEFPVTDMAASKRFYAAAFGWGFNDYGPDYAGIQGKGGEVGGFRLEKEIAAGGALVILYSDDLDATVAKVRDAGGQIFKEPFDFPGGRRFQFLDPNGNELAVWGEAAEKQ